MAENPFDPEPSGNETLKTKPRKAAAPASRRPGAMARALDEESTRPEYGSPEAGELGQFDLDLVAEAAEVQFITVRTAEGDLQVPASLDDWTGDAVQLLTDAKFRDALLATLKDSPERLRLAKTLTLGQIRRITEHVADLSGVSAGE